MVLRRHLHAEASTLVLRLTVRSSPFTRRSLLSMDLSALEQARYSLSEYRSRKNLHPGHRAIGSVFAIGVLLSKESSSWA
ncbi:Protein of unknown function [Pyronema omphalodes CBS 100304]|uniref:Uncharacterized protein n=1 Tax=Pyronema omphalodes (strain CBS 100304) TaxID=1076935 RepID=U4LP74_PYROM|nr:Protein of unknown function [Pyronema omphalodes CBS 100304]